MSGKPPNGPAHEPDHGLGALVVVQLDVGKAGVVVDKDMGELVARARTLVGGRLAPVTGDGVAGRSKRA